MDEAMLAPLMKVLEEYERKRKKAETIDDTYFEPGDMEFLDQYMGEYLPEKNMIILRAPVQGLRYDNRSALLEKMEPTMALKIRRDKKNEYNTNNFLVLNDNGQDIGSLPAPLCNALAPLYDEKLVTIKSVGISYLEKLSERSRYAVQGILFVQIVLKLKA